MTQFFLLAFLAFAPVAADMPQAARAALERTAKLYSDGAAHAAEFVQTYTPQGFSRAKQESGTVWIQAPQRLRFDYSAPEKKVFTYDDGEGRFYSPDDRQLDVRKLSAEERARLPIVFLTEPAELAREYSVSVRGAEEGASRLELEPIRPRPELARLELLVSSGGEIRGISYADEDGNRTEFRFEKWRVEKTRPAADFRVTGPKGTRIVE